MGSNIGHNCRNSKGQLQAGNWLEGYEQTPEHKAKVSLKAQARALTGYKHISVAGVTYPNLVIASEKVGVSSRTLRRHADSLSPKYKDTYYV